jgi:hypothetical protein
MQTIEWLKKNWLASGLTAYVVYRLMANQGSLVTNYVLLIALLAFALRPPEWRARVATLICLVLIATIFVRESYIAPRQFLNLVSNAPPPWFAPVNVEVYMGGERLIVSPMDRNVGSYSSIACFHTEDGLTLATAHGVSYDSGKVLVRLDDSPDARTEYATIACNDFGVVFPTLREPVGEKIPIANIDEIELAKAEVRQLGKAPIELEVKGYHYSGPVTFLVLWGEEPARQGYSGSPIIQNGKLIGSVYGYLRVSNRIWLARLATDLYQQVSTMTP